LTTAAPASAGFYSFRSLALDGVRSYWSLRGEINDVEEIMFRIHGLLAVAALGIASVFAAPAPAQTIIQEWSGVKTPPAPDLKSVTLDPKTTAIMVMDFVKQTCNSERRPRCVASIPKVEKLIAAARSQGDTGLENMLKDKGITNVIAVGTAVHGAVLYTASEAALRGFNVIVPVDGMSGDGQVAYDEQAVAYILTHAPIVSPKITLTSIDMIKF
jgi:Isochorismatase family